MPTNPLRAIIWDYDGTLADTRQKNLVVTRKIIKCITGKNVGEFPALQSLDNYMTATSKATNWREMYMAEYGMTTEQTDRAGRLWAEYQLQDSTPTPIYNGIAEVLSTLQSLPHGIVSQNARSNIAKALEEKGLSEYFDCIIGFEEVDIRRQKPEPDGLLLCIKELTGLKPGFIVYIGDHETDMRCTHNANRVLKENCLNMQILTIGALYGSDMPSNNWKLTPDYTVHTVQEIIHTVRQITIEHG